jgi:hypothetical protein
LLTRKGTDALIAVERMLDDADHALAAEPAASLGADGNNNGADNSSTPGPNTLATAADRVPATPRRD